MNEGVKFLKKLWYWYYQLLWFSKLMCHQGSYGFCSEEGLMFKNISFETLYSGQFTLTTQLIEPNYLVKRNTSPARDTLQTDLNQITTTKCQLLFDHILLEWCKQMYKVSYTWLSLFSFVKVTSQLFDIMSGQSTIDHPLCEECTDTLLDQLDQQLKITDDELKDYKVFFEKLNDKPSLDGEALSKELEKLRK